jgi:hypothetical protein
LIFFIDRSMGRHRFAKCLRDAGLECEVHDDRFHQETGDVDWMTAVADEGKIAVTRDQRIRRNAVEQEAVRRTGLEVLVIYEDGRSTEEMAEDFIRALPVIERELKHSRKEKRGGFVASVLPPSKGKKLGSVNRLYPPPERAQPAP